MKLPCPQCGEDIKLRRVSPTDNPIRKYPAVRPCPSCGIPLSFDLPGWVVPSLVGLFLALSVLAINLVEATEYAPLLQAREPGAKRFVNLLLTIPIFAIWFPVLVTLFRRLMRIEIA